MGSNAGMDPRVLLLKDVVEAAELHRETARHVLSHHTVLGLPESGGQGAYRRFNLIEACRLVNAARLVRFGMPLVRAEEVVVEIERSIRARTSPDEHPPYPFASGNSWRFRVLNARYAQAIRQRHSRNFKPADHTDLFHDVLEKKFVRIDDYGVMPMWEWDLSALGERLYLRVKDASK